MKRRDYGKNKNSRNENKIRKKKKTKIVRREEGVFNQPSRVCHNTHPCNEIVSSIFNHYYVFVYNGI